MAHTSEERERPSIGVVYLARFGEGLDAFQRFVDSYKKNPAGEIHDLVVIYKGFNNPDDLKKAKAIFHDAPHIGIELDDVGFDIGSYLEVSRRVNHTYLLFFNTYTQFTSANWLAFIYAHASRDGVGLAGAMGSYESLFDSFGLIQRVIFYCDYFKRPYDLAIHKNFDFIVNEHCRDWIDTAPSETSSGRSIEKANSLSLFISGKLILIKMYARWMALTSPGMALAEYRRYPGFPNAHIRSNGFMVRRDLLAEFNSPPIVSKMDACAFESGSRSLTTFVRQRAFKAVVVGRSGEGFDVADWPRSGTFRLGDESNLLVHDNQSLKFLNMSANSRATHTYMTWGNYLDCRPEGFPNLGIRFEGTLSPFKRKPMSFPIIDFIVSALKFVKPAVDWVHGLNIRGRIRSIPYIAIRLIRLPLSLIKRVIRRIPIVYPMAKFVVTRVCRLGSLKK